MDHETEMKKKKKTVLDAKNFEEKKKLQKELLQENWEFTYFTDIFKL